jgi:hypothetical protein
MDKENLLWYLARLSGKLIIGVDPGTVNFGIVIIRYIPLQQLLKFSSILNAETMLENMCKIIYAKNVNIKVDYGTGTFGISKYMETLHWIEDYWLKSGGKIKFIYEYQMTVNKHTRGPSEYIKGYLERLHKFYKPLIESEEKKPNFKKNIQIGKICINDFYKQYSTHRTVNKKFAAAVLKSWPYPIDFDRKKIDDIGDALLLMLV